MVLRRRPFFLAASVALVAAAATAAAPAARADVPAGYVQTQIASGLSRPVALGYAPDGRLFIGEQYTGRIKVLKNGAVLATPFATLPSVYTGNNETGLLGLAVDPDFARTGFVYALVTEAMFEQVVYRYRASGDAGVERTAVIRGLPSRGINHNGGGIAFGPDGHLYVSIGDNGNLPNDAQNRSSRRGKLLRFRKDGTVPSDNPFGNEVYCYGLRNTFRFCFQPGTGAIYSTENGEALDEINVLERGANFGWPLVEGASSSAQLRGPIAEFSPTIAPTGITFYAGAAMPALRGSFFFGDYKGGKVYRVVHTPGSRPTISEFVTRVPQPIDVVESPDGGLAICTLAGRIYKVTASAPVANQAPVASFTATPSSGPAPLDVLFDGRASFDQDGSIARHEWTFGDGTTGLGATVQHRFATPGTYAVTLAVVDDRGARATTTFSVAATTTGARATSAHIEAPPDGSTMPTNVVSFAGHGHDDGRVVEHRWSFGDGTADVVIASGVTTDGNTTPSHAYARAGTYTVTLAVRDDAGNRATHSIRVTVPAPPGGGVGDDGFEPNDARTAAAPIVAGAYPGLRADDDDWYAVALAVTGTITVRIDFSHAEGDLDLVLEDAGGRRLAISESTGNSETVRVQGLAAGTYRVRVYGYQGARAGYSLTVGIGADAGPVAARTGVVTAGRLTVRSGPGSTYPILGYFVQGTRLTIVDERSSYYRVTFQGAPATASYWVYKTYVRLD